ncbi:PREDICTED: uncharacterized protein LOC101298393 [Fragaria vesca subsp. vesca]|uniref:uncharacterized protein LOC101298393 n=1 Tax=Fragaria vesca subsp. vesca TaxID=101020 RepID=UPI0002C33D28|nr:PREDICTED: uncharacterized protein LOC101298393 [Fragaria vesca subsp. vesca]
MSTSTNSVTEEQLHAFYRIDREIFSRLVVSFMRDPAESLMVMALWQWLEKDYRNILVKMSGLADNIVNGLADEAVLCLRCLDHTTSNSSLLCLVPNGGMILTSTLTQKEITLHMFIQNRYTTICGVKNFLTNVCARIFTDILQRVLPGANPILSQFIHPQQPLVIPGFPHPVFGALNVMPKFVTDFTPTGGLWGWSPSIELSVDDKTMFLTFSRGFHVSVEEVKQLFSNVLGMERCVEDVDMENVPSDEQPLYAKMVLSSVKLVDKILKGNRVAKFRINGKHIWARKYERRD